MNGQAMVTVGQVMTRSVRTIEAMATVRQALSAMVEHDVSSLVIERRDEHDELGIVVIADIAMHVIAAKRSPDRVNVYEIMSKPVVSLREDMDIKYAIRLLARFDLSRAVVVDWGGHLGGLVTLRDMVLRYAAQTEGPL